MLFYGFAQRNKREPDVFFHYFNLNLNVHYYYYCCCYMQVGNYNCMKFKAATELKFVNLPFHMMANIMTPYKYNI